MNTNGFQGDGGLMQVIIWMLDRADHVVEKNVCLLRHLRRGMHKVLIA